MLQNALEEQWKKKPIEERRRIINEVKVRVQEIITGSRAPK